MHFFASRVLAWTLIWHDSMIYGNPKSPSKDNFGPTSHVLCMCLFLIWFFIKSKIIMQTFRFLYHHTLCGIISVNRQNLPVFWQFKVLMTRVLTLNWGVWQLNPNGGSKNLKVYQVDMCWKGRIERNTMQVFLDWFNASAESYTKKTVKMFPFYWFFEFLRHKKLCDFYHFCTSYFI